MFYVEPL